MKSLKQFVFEKMENQGYVLDSEVSRFLKSEPNYCTIETYKEEYQRLKYAKEYFKEFENNKNTIISRSGRRYLIRDKTWENLKWFSIPKSYYEYLKKIGIEKV